MNNLITYLKNKNLVWQGQMHTAAEQVCTSGYPELDEWLQGGIPKQGVVAIDTDIGIGELRLLLPYALARQTQQSKLLVFIAPPLNINGEMLAEMGFDLSGVLLLTPDSQQDALWAAEQCLKSDCCHTVLSWLTDLEIHQIKRLQLAAKQGNAVQFIFQKQRNGSLSLPVTMSLSLEPQVKGLRIKMNKRIGSWLHQHLDLDMQRYWPAFKHPEEQQQNNNIIPFPERHVS